VHPSVLPRGAAGVGADYPAPVQGDFVIRNFPLAAGGIAAELKLHYRPSASLALTPRAASSTRSSCSTAPRAPARSFLRAEFAGELFGAGQLLDATTFFVVIVDNIATASRASPATDCGGVPEVRLRDMVTR